MSGEDDFLSRWSRRKRRPAPAPETPAPSTPAEPPEPAEARSDEEVLKELGLKEPDTLVSGDDFRAYLQAAVPAHIRRRALRRLWRSNPVLAVQDGLNDYDWDETGNTVAKGTLKTAYQVGRGFAERARKVADHIEQAAEDAPGAEQDPAPAATEVEPPMQADAFPETGPEDPPAPTRRRMVFRTFRNDDGDL